MSKSVERVTEHKLWSLFPKATQVVMNALKREGLDAYQIDLLQRLGTVVRVSKSSLELIDPVLLVPAMLEDIAIPLDHLVTNVGAFADGGEAIKLEDANGNADTFLANFGRIFRSETAEDIDSVRKSAAEYREAVGDFLKSSIAEQKQLSDAVKSSSERVLEVSSTVDATVKQIQSAASQQQSEFSAAQDKRATEFSASQAEFLSKFTETLAAHNTEFTEDQNQRKSSYSELEVATKKQIGDLISNFNEQLKSHEQSYLADEKILKDSSTEKLDGLNLQFSEKAKGVLGEIQAMRSQVENLVGVIGNLGVTAGYKKVADEAKKMLYIWQFVTVASLVGLIMVAGSTAISVNALDAETVELIKLSIASGKPAVDGSLLDKAGNTFFYQKLLSRLFLSVTFGVFATYSAKQASRFFEVEKRNRKLALELEALGPFIEPLDKHDKDKFRVQVGDRSFGVPDGSVKIDNESESVTLLDWLKSKDGLENLVGQVKKIWKAD